MNKDVAEKIQLQYKVVMDVRKGGKGEFEGVYFTSFYDGYLAACKDNGLITPEEHAAKTAEFKTAIEKTIFEKYGL